MLDMLNLLERAIQQQFLSLHEARLNRHVFMPKFPRRSEAALLSTALNEERCLRFVKVTNKYVIIIKTYKNH